MGRRIVEVEVATERPQQTSTQRGDRLFGAVALLLVLLLAAVLLSTAVGAEAIPLRALLRAVAGLQALSPSHSAIVLQIRLPRICAAGLVGASLSIAGLLFQGLFRNPMADPYVTGSSGGAALGAAVGLFLLPQFSFLGFSAISMLAFLGSLGAIVLVYWVARIGDRSSVVPLLLAGFAISTMLSYSTYFIQLLDQNYGGGTRVLAAWLQGAISSPQWSQLAVATSLMLIAGVASIPLARLLNTLALGEDYAQQLGVHLKPTRVSILIIGSLLAATAVSLSGIISFVGLIVPHICRQLIGPDHLRLLPVVALAGAIFLILADTLARTLLSPSEIPVGVLTAFVGAPFFLYLLRRGKTEAAL
jgi:iron complex transport system permease protein